VTRALNDSLAVLDVALAIALVALAIVLPIGLVALLLFWATSSVRQRSRERALATSASS
jgi:protein-S-isoprenylcysteine O-methyltransferase Ste14